MQIKKIFLLLAVLPIIGAGCLRIGPRITRVPDVLPGAAVTSTGPADKSEAQKEVAYLYLDGGQAEVMRGNNRTSAKNGTALYSGDRVNTVSGVVTLLYPDAGESQIEAPADFLVLASGDGQGTLFTEIRLFAGSIWTRLEKLLGNEEQFSVAASGVVATVRGTAFGVSLINNELDIQVADHEVEITTEEEQAIFVSSTEKMPIRQAVKIAAGEGIKMKVVKGAKIDFKSVKNLIRKLDKIEMEKKGFVFGLRSIPLQKLKRPPNPVRLPLTPIIPKELLLRLYMMRQILIKEAVLRGFAPPTRGVLEQEYAPTGTSREIQGPTSTLRSAADDLNLLNVEYQTR